MRATPLRAHATGWLAQRGVARAAKGGERETGQSIGSITGIVVVITGTDADMRVPSSRRASAN